MLAEHVLGWDTARLLAHGDEPASPAFTERYASLVERRAAREPVAYITGLKEFWNLTFEVSPAVLIPRPETEGLIAHVLQRVADPTRPRRIADVCTGSGCVAVALAVEYPHARVVATDISAAALDVARRNAARHGVANQIAFASADVLAGVAGPFDVIVANPPYVADRAREDLQAEVRFEPEMALFAGADGLDVIRRLLEQAGALLAPDGLLLFEFGFGQEPAVRELISNALGLTMSAIEPDFSGIPRIAIATRANA